MKNTGMIATVRRFGRTAFEFTVYAAEGANALEAAREEVRELNGGTLRGLTVTVRPISA